MSDEVVDRIQAQEIADLLGIDVTAIPGDHDTLTRALWEVVGLGDEPLPESVETRWQLIGQALIQHDGR